MKTVDIQAELRAHIARKYKNQKTAAEAWGVKPPFVSAVLRGEKQPTSIMLDDAGFERIRPDAVYVKVKK